MTDGARSVSGTLSDEQPRPTFRQAVREWARIGCLSFGGPAAQIALMHRVVVDERRWLTERQFLDALSFCMLLPGPEAMQLATFAGWRLHGVRGGLAAGLLFVVPGALVVLGLAAIYAVFGAVSLVAALFLGIKAAVLVIVVQALLRIAAHALAGPGHWWVAGAAFLAIFFLDLPFPLIVLAAGLFGFVHGGAAGAPTQPAEVSPPRIAFWRTGATILVWLVIWWAPILAALVLPAPAILPEIGLFFSRLAVVTFGGAYAVLAYMAQDVVGLHGWLTPGEMLDGLGLAETTPGPLILVTEFVGFLSGWREGGAALGLAGALMALHATFAPCFLWIFAGAPYVERIASQPRLRGSLTAITAAVVGVILNLSIWFAIHVVFADVSRIRMGWFVLWIPDLATVDWRVLFLVSVAAILVFRLRWGIAGVLAASAAIGAGFNLI